MMRVGDALDDSDERARQQQDAETETEALRTCEDGKFHLDEKTIIFFDKKDLVYDQKLDAMGKGTYSEMVYKGIFKPFNKPIAVKAMQIYDRASGNNELRGIAERSREAAILRRSDGILRHANVVALYGFVTEDFSFYMCMELMDASLFEVKQVVYGNPGKLQPKAEMEAFLGCVAVAVVDALAFFRNDARVIHRDLKPANIMLNDLGEIKLCDFGVSKKLQTAVSKTRATTGGMGTNIYMAPERHSGQFAVAKGYGSKSEVWSLGLTLPFPIEEITDESKEPPKLTDAEYSIKLRTFITACLFKSEASRACVLPYTPEATSRDKLPEETNNVQSKNFYTFHNRRTDRNACVIQMLEHIRDGLPAIRAKLGESG